MTELDVPASLPTELIYKIFTLISQEPQPLKTAIALSQVSWQWRNLAINTRSLWAKIIVSFNGPPAEVLDTYLARAGRFPLDLRIDFRPPLVDNATHVLQSAFRVVKRYSTQLHSLDVSSTMEACFALGADVLKDAHAPALKELSLRFQGQGVILDDDGVMMPLFASFVPAHSLKTYRFCGIDLFCYTHFPSTKRLYISDCQRSNLAFEPNDLLDFLRNYPLLEHLAVQCSFICEPENFLLAEHIPRMEFLHSLVVSNPFAEDMRKDCQALQDVLMYAPKLDTLAFLDLSFMDLRIFFNRHWDPEQPRHHFPNLKTLAIIRPPDISFRGMSAHMTSLAHMILILTAGNRTLENLNQIFARLLTVLCPSEESSDGTNRPDSTTPVPWQNLRTLTIDPVCMQTLCKIVENRAVLGHPISKVRMQMSSLNDEDRGRLPWLQTRVQIEDVDPSDVIAKYEDGLADLKVDR